jgi:dipeptidyl aminopeptidase/acylaminoacyl peptidase
MIRLPLIDPHRVAIMGGSFGGYLAIAGVEQDPGLYRCALTTAGVFDWQEEIDSEENASPGAYEILRKNLGKKPDRSSWYSLLDHTDQIKVPVFIAHGNDDHTVDVEQSAELARALKKRGIPHETFFRDLEGHGFFKYKDRVDYYHRVEAFLAANLGGASLAPEK